MCSKTIGLYIHWPFCEKKCPYCDFNSHVPQGSVNQQAYKEALQKELCYFQDRLGDRLIKTIFFGGGTPSLMQAEICAELLEFIHKHWHVDENAEITLEANPSSAEMEKFRLYKQAGINRLSLGVQALDDNNLQMLGRLHNRKEALKAMAMGKEIFERFSFDLIYARPGQTEAAWRKELVESLEYAKGHLSLYQLTIEKGTIFHSLYRKGAFTPLDDERAVALYQMTDELLTEHNMPAYEISNFARVGHESQHNLLYWRYKEYLGLGPGAHSRLIEKKHKRTALFTEYHPERWLNAIAEKGHAVKNEETLSPQAQGNEMLLMGLRLREPFDLTIYEEVTKSKVPPQIIKALVEEELLTNVATNKIQVTKKGHTFLNHIIFKLASYSY